MRRNDAPQAAREEGQGLILPNESVRMHDGRPSNNQHALEVYRELLVPLVRRNSIDYTDMLRLAEFRSTHQITESQHFTVLSEMGITKEAFAQRIQNGQKGPSAPLFEQLPPSVHNAPSVASPSAAFPSINPPSALPPSDLAVPTIQHTRWSHCVLWCAIFTGALWGLFVRIGTSELDTHALEGVSGAVLIANVLGCIVMGFVTSFERWHLYSRSHDILYVAITSGFCGSLTTFSALNLEAIKLLFLQWNTQSPLSTHGNFVWQWLFWLWAGVLVPLAALRFGQHLALVCPCKPPGDSRRVRVLWVEVVLVLLFLASLIAAIVVPLLLPPSRVHLTYAALMGGVGALLRYFISGRLNPCVSSFPLGTFCCNLLGTPLMVGVALIAKFVVHPSDWETLAVCYGVMTGFCGCLTTISSFESELHKLGIANVRHAYVYGLTSIGLAQLISLLLFCLVSQAEVSSYLQSVPAVDLCATYNSTCFHALSSIGCPSNVMVVAGCMFLSPSNPVSELASFEGQCRCGQFDVGPYVADILVDTHMLNQDLLVSLWPVDSRSVPTHTFDLCASFNSACTEWLQNVKCPYELRVQTSCERRWLADFKGVCTCGNMKAGIRLTGTLLDSMLYTNSRDADRRTTQTDSSMLNLCVEQKVMCEEVLSRIQCPDNLRNVVSCESAFDNRSSCLCGNVIPQNYVDSRVIRRQVVPQIQQTQAPAIYDMCASFDFTCSDILTRIQCPLELQARGACASSLERWVGQCSCGNRTNFGETVVQVLLASVAGEFMASYVNQGPLTDPYRNLISSDALKMFSVVR